MSVFGEIRYNGKNINVDKLTSEEIKTYWYRLETDNDKLIHEQNYYLSEILK
jgi:hypothetical protein